MAADVAAVRRDIELSEGSPSLRWPYHQAVVAGGMVFVAGQIGVRGTPPADQAEEAYRRVRHYLTEAGASPEDVVRERVYLVDSELMPVVAEVHNRFYRDHWPPTTAVITGRNGGPDIEVEVTAVIGSGGAA
jgi:2-iminobutanoate/2-iminopropanoate deaminase